MSLRQVSPPLVEPAVPLVDAAAEEAVIGCCLAWVGATEEADAVGLRPEHFGRPSFGEAFTGCIRLVARGEHVDTVSLRAELASAGLAGPAAADLLAAMAEAPSIRQGAAYAAIVLDRFRRRQLALALTEATTVARAPGTFAEVAVEVDRLVTAALVTTEDGAGLELVGPAAERVLVELQSGASPRLSTGLSDLDRQLGGGLGGGQLIVVGARPSMGKTSLALGFARHVAASGRPVLYGSAEMSSDELAERVLIDEAGVPSHRVRPGPIGAADLERLGLGLATIGAMPLHILDRDVTFPRLAAAARVLARRGGLALIVLDYLQLAVTDREERRELEVARLAGALKRLARELGVPVVALSQLSRAVETRSDRRPVLADLRESGALEQDADVVIGLYRDEVYRPDSPDAGVAELLVIKHRGGPTGVVRCYWLGPRMAFRSLAPDDRGLP